ncbi:Hypothetical_protein [Hexamita inflata]|uniref:Hypothetical_protein n=1 Tax=Hexamita inflata TaxID=28002 RepID=A0AA86QVX1_9EUKA|nr:Hypothetical protein HINF_LOCUS53270 [Hexamita inflata]
MEEIQNKKCQNQSHLKTPFRSVKVSFQFGYSARYFVESLTESLWDQSQFFNRDSGQWLSSRVCSTCTFSNFVIFHYYLLFLFFIQKVHSKYQEDITPQGAFLRLFALKKTQKRTLSHHKLRLYWLPFFSDHHISFPFQTNDPQETNNIPLQPNISHSVITRHTSSQTLRQLFLANGVCFGDLFVDNSFWLRRGVACYCVSVVSYLVKVQTREQCHKLVVLIAILWCRFSLEGNLYVLLGILMYGRRE